MTWRPRTATPPETPLAMARAARAGWADPGRYPITVALLEWWAYPYSHRRRRFLAVLLSIAEARGVPLPPDTWV